MHTTKKTLALAQNLVAIPRAEDVQGKFNLKSDAKAKRSFLNYFAELTEEKQNEQSANNYGNWFSTLAHLRKCVSHNVRFEDIDETFVKRVRDYFDTQAKTKSDVYLSQNS